MRDNADPVVNITVPIGAGLVFLDPLVPVPFMVTAAVMMMLVVVLVLHPPVPRRSQSSDSRGSA
jgi:hypothetical protein